MPSDPLYSPELEFNPTFKWGGRRWGVNDRDDFLKFLKKRGRSYTRWARNHPNAAKVFDPDEQDIYSTFAPEFAGIDAERKRTAAMFDRRMRNLGGFYGAIAPLLGGIGPAIRGVYGEGSETMSSAGTGFGSILNESGAADAAAANFILQSIGAPAGQMISGGDPGGVLAGLAGWVPATMMGEQGAAHGAAADQLPKTAALEAQIMMKDLLGQAGEADEEFSDAVLGVLRELPAYRSKLKAGRAAERIEQQKFRLSQLKEEHDWLKDQAAMALAAKRFDVYEKYMKLAALREERYRLESMGLDAAGNIAPNYYEDAQGRIVPKGMRYNQKGELVDIPSSGKGKKGSTSSTVPGTAAYNAAAVKAIGEARDEVDTYIEEKLRTRVKGSVDDYEVVPYDQAMAQLMDVFGYLGTTPTARKRLKIMLGKALAAAGIRKSSRPPSYDKGGGAG